MGLVLPLNLSLLDLLVLIVGVNVASAHGINVASTICPPLTLFSGRHRTAQTKGATLVNWSPNSLLFVASGTLSSAN